MMDAKELFDTLTGYVNRRFYQKREHLFESSGAVSKLMPILTNTSGKVDGSFLDLSDYVLQSDLTTTLADYALLDGGNTFTGDQTISGGSTGVDLMADGWVQMRAGSIAVSAGTTGTFDISPGAGYQGLLVMAAWHGDSGTGTGTAVWMVGGFMNTSANTRITEITNVGTSGGAMTLVWQASGVLRFSLANTSGGQPKQARVSWIRLF